MDFSKTLDNMVEGLKVKTLANIIANRAKSLISVGQSLMRGDNVTPVTSLYRSP